MNHHMVQQWDLSPDEAQAVQQQLAPRVVRENQLGAAAW